jgi:MFS family permease
VRTLAISLRAAFAWRRFHPNARYYLAYSFGFGLYWAMANLGINLLLRAEGLHNDAIGRVDMLIAVGTLLVGLPAGALSDRVGRRPLLIAGGAVSALSLLGVAWAPPGPLQDLAALLYGSGQVITFSVGYPHMAENSRADERIALFSASTFLVYVSGFLGFLLAGAIPAAASAAGGGPSDGIAPMRTMLTVGSALGALAVLPLLRLGRPAYAERRLPGEPRRKLPLGVYARLCLPHFVIGLGAGAMVLFFQLFFRERFGIPPALIGVLIGAAQLPTAAGALLSPKVAEKLGAVRGIILLQAASLPFLAVIAYVPMLAPVVLAYYVRGALMNMVEPIYNGFAMDLVPASQRALLTSASQGAWTSGFMIGPLISGIVQVRAGFSGAFSITLGCYAVAIVTFAAFFLRPRQAPPLKHAEHAQGVGGGRLQADEGQHQEHGAPAGVG